MNLKAAVKGAVKVSEEFLKKNGPTILMGFGVGLMVGGTAAAVVATTKAVPVVENLTKNTPDGTPPKKLTIVGSCWKLYAPAFIMTLAGASCVVGANHMNLMRISAAVAAANMNKEKLEDYKKAAEKAFGKEGAEKIEQSKAEDKVRAIGPAQGQYPGKGPTLCQDCQTNARFWSSRNAIQQAANEINKRVLSGEGRQTLNDFFYELDIPECDIGKSIGWEIDTSGRYNRELAIDYRYVADEITGDPILFIDYDVEELLPF